MLFILLITKYFVSLQNLLNERGFKYTELQLHNTNNMDEKKIVIEVSLKIQKEIAGKFNVTERTVQSALRFDTNSPSARLFRSYALNHGGQQYEVTKKKVESKISK